MAENDSVGAWPARGAFEEEGIAGAPPHASFGMIAITVFTDPDSTLQASSQRVAMRDECHFGTSS
jgi:hypothetical protein